MVFLLVFYLLYSTILYIKYLVSFVSFSVNFIAIKFSSFSIILKYYLVYNKPFKLTIAIYFF